MTDEGWVRDALFKNAYDMGAASERQRASDARVDVIAKDMKEALVAMQSSLEAQYSHLRGEIKTASDSIERRRLEDNDLRNEDIAATAAGLEAVKTLFRRLVAGLAVFFFLLSVPQLLPALVRAAAGIQQLGN